MKRRILVAALDWGLGHASRCVPIIREFQKRNCEVMIAGSGDSLALLRKEFPGLLHFSLPGYKPKYGRRGNMVFKMAMQLPHFLSVIRKEHHIVAGIIKDHQVDAVISDNRYGCWASLIPSIIVTHQRNILMPKGFGWLGFLVAKLNHRQIRKFDTCWIPDNPAQMLAGTLASPVSLADSEGYQYIGYLSRFNTKESMDIIYDVVVLLSGPEPQRTILENLLAPQLQNSGLKYFIIRGKLTSNRRNELSADHLFGDELRTMLQSAALIIARSGYSTIMDLKALRKNAILIPTPGQTEQEYLAKHLMERSICYSVAQEKFELREAIDNAQRYPGFLNNDEAVDLLPKAVDSLLTKL